MPDPKKPKPSKALIRQRTEEILRIILDGAESPWDTCAYVREREKEAGSAWELPPGGKPMSDSQIRRYVARATAMISESCRASRKKLLRRHLAQRRNLYAKALSQGDVRAALVCVADEAKLLGLYAPVKVAPTTPNGDQSYAPLADAERAAAIAQLLACLGPAGAGPDCPEPASPDGPLLGGPGPADESGGDDPGCVAI
jgi:hypothetical protein